MEEYTRIEAKWKVNDMIRNKETGHPYLVLHVSKYYCNIIDLEANNSLAPTLTLLPRDFGNYAQDKDMEVKKNATEAAVEFVFQPIYL